MNLQDFSKSMIYLGMLLLSACAYFDSQHQQFDQNRRCHAHCDQRYQYCTHICDDNENLCRMKAKANAAVHFAQYKHRQQVQGQVVAAELAAFRDPLACRKTTCDCDQDKNMCKQACRGSIRKRLQYAMQLN